MSKHDELVKALRSASTVSTAWEKLMLDAAAAIEALQAQLPKRGEWVKGPDGIYHCSVCGATAPYLDAFDGVIQYWENLFYCNSCGAKMEVQE